jgi:hypothetical protein
MLPTTDANTQPQCWMMTPTPDDNTNANTKAKA